ncbi:MAG TPA: polysaccharide biosynthesis C-terminal domain-containing protein, partial [Flavobacteriales bacterium]|nr:polysaccharide biosynthesis C-terminal domain-containing protein [Flavobacteriales bacterium]
IANGFVLLGSFIAVRGNDQHAGNSLNAFLDLFRLGFFAQLANGLQLMNYRFAYYLVDRFQGNATLGMFSITTQLAESTWLAPKSLGTVLYARVSNIEERDHQRDLTLAVLKVAVAFAALISALLLLLPIDVYRWVFGDFVHDLGPVIVWMIPGLLAMSASQAYSHFLSGTGRVYHNTIASGIGLVITVAVGYRWIPVMGLYGAALASSAAYTAATLYQLVVFNRISGARLRHYLPNAQDAERIAVLRRRLLGR